MPFVFESLENRTLLSGLTPAQIKHAYGFDLINFAFQGTTYTGSGRGETIAIVDAHTAPTIVSDLMTFDAMYGLPNTDSSQNFVLTIATPQGTPSANATWAQETTMDVEWAHAIAPKAHILLVEAKSDSFSDLFGAVDFARKQQGVCAVSISWVGAEFPGEVSYDSIFTTPSGHRPVTFFAATGDSGLGAVYPAASPNMISIGGTTLTVDGNGKYISERAWSFGGGGVSALEGTTTPAIAYSADPATGFMIYDSTPLNGHSGWLVDAGTSAGAPQWAALVAIADQGRSYQGLAALDGVSQTIPALQSIPQSDYHDIITGNNGTKAVRGYDQATGYGTPKAIKVVTDLIAYGTTSAAKPAAVAAVFPTNLDFGATLHAMPTSDDWLHKIASVLN